ncbi:MFS transporter permease [uncultured Planococcus sp.]|uniref:MFS transporter permease n=1 Tax=uncultured Planococcus sp. TaxID=337815 RepID=UPI002628A1D0|nr:MFS transporter permease [uncultured Planococcus sp.]
MKKANIIMWLTVLIAAVMLAKAFILNEDIKLFLLIFFGIGSGLAFLRLFVNNSIKKMKDKDWKVKVLFFAVLLGFGFPFQSWFRNEVLFSMGSDFLAGSITLLVVGLLFMTTFFGYAVNKFHVGNAEE